MRGLTVVVAGGGDAARLRTALGLAAAQAAHGGRASLFLDGDAAGLLAALPADDRETAAGLPGRAELVETCLALGVAIGACQSGLALAGIDAGSLDARIATGGLVAVLAALGEDRLVVV